MSRKFERVAVFIVGIWQIIVGFITIYLYANRYKQSSLTEMEFSIVQEKAIQSFESNLYIFTVSLGLLYVLMGVINIYLSRKIIDQSVQRKIPFILIIMGIVSYLLMDIVSGILCLSAGVLALSKNKLMKQIN